MEAKRSCNTERKKGRLPAPLSKAWNTLLNIKAVITIIRANVRDFKEADDLIDWNQEIGYTLLRGSLLAGNPEEKDIMIRAALEAFGQVEIIEVIADSAIEDINNANERGFGYSNDLGGHLEVLR